MGRRIGNHCAGKPLFQIPMMAASLEPLQYLPRIPIADRICKYPSKVAGLPSLRSLGLLELHHLTSHDERVQGELIHLAPNFLWSPPNSMVPPTSERSGTDQLRGQQPSQSKMNDNPTQHVGPEVGPPSNGADISLGCNAKGNQAGEGSGEGQRSLGIHSPRFKDNWIVKYLWIDESVIIVQGNPSSKSCQCQHLRIHYMDFFDH